MFSILWYFLLTAAVAFVAVHTQYYATTQTPFTCTPVTLSHPELTGENLYKQLHKDYAVPFKGIDDIGAAHMNDSNPGFFLGKIIGIHKVSILLQDIITGKQPANEANCLEVVKADAEAINEVLRHADDVIADANSVCTSQATCCSSLTGEQNYQYILQQSGQALRVIVALGEANINKTDAGQWLQVAIDGAKAVRQLNDVASGQAGPFNATACLAGLKLDADAFVKILSTLSDSAY